MTGRRGFCHALLRLSAPSPTLQLAAAIVVWPSRAPATRGRKRATDTQHRLQSHVQLQWTQSAIIIVTAHRQRTRVRSTDLLRALSSTALGRRTSAPSSVQRVDAEWILATTVTLTPLPSLRIVRAPPSQPLTHPSTATLACSAGNGLLRVLSGGSVCLLAELRRAILQRGNTY